MEWAVGKQYDVYRPNTGKLLLPGAKIWWDIHTHAVGEQITDHVELAVYLYPKGEVPKYRTYLTMFNAASSKGGSPLDIPPNTVAQTEEFPRAEASRAAREFSAAHASARQSDVDGSDSAGRLLCRPSATSIISTSTG